MPYFNVEKLRQPEQLKKQIESLRSSHPEFAAVADIADMCLSSSATNDYLEKVGAESIGAKHLSDKLGPDGREDNGKGCEIKPKKDTPGTKTIGVVNDDTPMKLLETHLNYGTLVALNATKEGTKINWALAVPYSYFEESRYREIVKNLGLLKDTTWAWGDNYPVEKEKQLECLQELVKRHKPRTYVRSNTLSLDVLQKIPKSEIAFWKHPDLDTKSLHKILQTLVIPS